MEFVKAFDNPPGRFFLAVVWAIVALGWVYFRSRPRCVGCQRQGTLTGAPPFRSCTACGWLEDGHGLLAYLALGKRVALADGKLSTAEIRECVDGALDLWPTPYAASAITEWLRRVDESDRLGLYIDRIPTQLRPRIMAHLHRTAAADAKNTKGEREELARIEEAIRRAIGDEIPGPPAG